MKQTGKSHWERFQAATARGDDGQTEALVPSLTRSDTPALLTLLARGGDGSWWAIRGLAQVGDERAVPMVVTCLQSIDPGIRSVAALALGQLFQRHPEDVQPFLSSLAALLADDDGLVRQSAADSLAQCGDAAVDILAIALDREHAGARVRAAAALHRIGTKKSALPLYHHLDDSNPLVRHYAFETLDRLGLLTNVLLTRE